MTKTKKIGFLAAAVASAVTAAHAASNNGDLIIGFTAQVGTDLMYDLGSPTSITNGQSWNLNTLLASFELDTVKWGVVGSSGATEVAWATLLTGTPPTLNEGQWNAQDIAVNSIFTIFPTAGSGQKTEPSSTFDNSWNQQTVAGALFTQYHNAYLNPNAIGLATINFYSTVADSSPPTLVGNFTLGANGVVTFHTASAPTTPPTPRIVSVTRTNTTSTISFTTTNGSFNYRLFFTNIAGLTTPSSNWPVSATSVIGNGLTNSISDTSTDLIRFYRVGVQ